RQSRFESRRGTGDYRDRVAAGAALLKRSIRAPLNISFRGAMGVPSARRVFNVRVLTAPAPAAGWISTKHVLTSPGEQEPAATPFRSIVVALCGGPDRSSVMR